MVENIGTIQNIRSIKKLITGDTDTSRPAPIESWAVMQNEDDPFEEPRTLHSPQISTSRPFSALFFAKLLLFGRPNAHPVYARGYVCIGFCSDSG